MRRAVGMLLVLAVLGACTDGGGDDEEDADVPAPSEQAGFVPEDTWRARQDDFLAFATRELVPSSPLNLLSHVERARRDDGFDADISVATVADHAETFADIDTFEDTTDFDLLYLLNLWLSAADELDPTLRAAIEERFLAFKYWYTEPTPEGIVDDKYYWSENHRIIFHTLEHLVGQSFPDAVFTNDGRTGAEHRDEARTRILEWLDEKVRFGFTEWHSDVYYQKDVTPLLTLVEWSDDEEIRTRAAMVLDIVLFDLALHVHDGYFGATHGRSYVKDKTTSIDEDTFGLTKLLFDDTPQPYQSTSDPGATLLARAQRYRLPAAIAAVATSDEVLVDRERMGVPLDPLAPVTADPEAPYGYDFDDPASIPFWWERGAQTAWQVVPQTIRTLDEHGLWDSQFFSPFAPLADAVRGNDDAARTFAQSLAPMLGFGLLTEAHTYTYRSPHVMLSTVQDHRPGVFAEQQHTWQATLDHETAVWTTHPRNEPLPDTQWPDRDGYWNGTGSTPRAAQVGTVAISIYDPIYEPQEPGGPLETFTYLPYTHAWFPRERMDEWEQVDGWTLGRTGDAYVALWSMRPVAWRTHGDEVFTRDVPQPFDLVADGGPQNVWVVEVGDVDGFGSYEAFRDAVLAAPITAGPDLRVAYASPSQGALAFGVDGPLTVDGETVALDDHPRFDNRYASVPWGSTRYEIAADGHRLVLDFEAGSRTAG